MTNQRATTPRTWHACEVCGRRLPNRCHHRQCATCIKVAQGKPVMRFNRALHRYVEVRP